MSSFASDDEDHVLLADSVAGTITKLNVRTGEHAIVARDPTMLPLPTGLVLGINGIHVECQKVYYTSLDQGIFASIDISPRTGALAGKPEVLTSGLLTADDFDFSPKGMKAFKANNGVHDTITEVDIQSMSLSTAANSSLLQAGSAVAFGKKSHSSVPMYVTASGVVGNETVGHVVYADVPLSYL